MNTTQRVFIFIAILGFVAMYRDWKKKRIETAYQPPPEPDPSSRVPPTSTKTRKTSVSRQGVSKRTTRGPATGAKTKRPVQARKKPSKSLQTPTIRTSTKYDKYIVIDFETTGKDWPYFAVEAAWIEVDSALNETTHMHSLIKPPIAIPQETSKIHGIYDRHVANQPSIDYFFTELCQDRFGSLDICIIGHNVSFDLRIFDRFCGSAQPLCTMAASRLSYPKLHNHKLPTVAGHLGLGANQTHRALADARLSLAVLRKLNENLELSIPELVQYTLTPPEPCLMPWGKYKGAPLSQLPTPYLRWLAPKTNPDYLRVAVTSELSRRS